LNGVTALADGSGFIITRWNLVFNLMATLVTEFYLHRYILTF
jgi:hypothetical protein